jgi:ParE toxin of type II toxin-antitoxin system, parDE
MPSRVRITANFQQNLDSIRTFLVEQEAEGGFDSLIKRHDVIPNLEGVPKMGRDFLARDPLSDEGRAKRHALKIKSGSNTEIREYITDEYLILYAVRDSVMFLLSVRHHRQLSFDLRAHWL